jgi:hypothetical protein
MSQQNDATVCCFTNFALSSMFLIISICHLLGTGCCPRLVRTDGPPVLLRIQPAVRDRVDRIMPPEEQLPFVVSQRDTLSVNFEMHNSRIRLRFLQDLIDRLSHGFGSRQRLHIEGEQIQNVAGRALGQQLLSGIVGGVLVLQVALGEDQPTRKRQRGDRVLVHERRQRTEHRFRRTPFQLDATRGGLDQEVADQLVALDRLRLQVRRDR